MGIEPNQLQKHSSMIEYVLRRQHHQSNVIKIQQLIRLRLNLSSNSTQGLVSLMQQYASQ
jgi:hypothetical protein